MVRGYSSAGRAPALQAGGRRFDPDYLHQTIEAGRLLRIDESVQAIERLHLVSKETGNCTLKTEQCIKCDEKQGNREVFQRNLEESCEFLIVEHFC